MCYGHMDFPSRDPRETEFTTEMQNAVNGLNAKAYISRDIMLVLDREEDVFSGISKRRDRIL